MDSPTLVARMESCKLNVGFPELPLCLFSLLDLVVLTTQALSGFNAYMNSCINTDNSTVFLPLLWWHMI
jgi:hypothetical protein